MALKKEEKGKIIKTYKQHTGDTGSSEVQIALITERMNQLVGHLKKNPKDNHSRHGLLLLVSQRKKLLSYLNRTNIKSYKKLVGSLGIR
jgi:small subunit ribosomal protein S15